MKYNTIPIKCDYIKPNEGYEKLINTLSNHVQEGDYIFISETPISTLEGSLVDESLYNYGIVSYILTEIWSKLIWGYFLGILLGYSKRTITNLRNMPVEARNHKEFILQEYGLKHALQPTAEAGVDLSNVPGNLVSLLPQNPKESAWTIKNMIKEKIGINIEVVIIDTDPTYKSKNTYFTTLPKSVNKIKNDTGIFGYILRAFSKKIGATPLASTSELDLETLISMANLAEDCQRDNSEDFFETIYNMKNAFDTDFDSITVEMLETVTHIPAIIIR